LWYNTTKIIYDLIAHIFIMTTSLKYTLVTIIAFTGLFIAPTVFGATLTVNSTIGEQSVDGQCNFSEAISSIHAGVDQGDCIADITEPYGTNDRIEFNIGGGGVQTIIFNGGDTFITKPVIIDGITQPGGASCGTTTDLSDRNLLINLDFNNTTRLAFEYGSEGSHLRGVAIYGSSAAGVQIENEGNMTISCNHIGLDTQGDALLPLSKRNYFGGIAGWYLGPTALQNVTIGGPNVGDGNVITGNLCAGVEMYEQKLVNLTIENNRVGTDRAGLVALGNYEEGISLGSGSALGQESQNITIRDNIVGGNQASDYTSPTNCTQNEGGAEISFQGGSLGSAIQQIDLVFQGNFVGVGSDGITPLTFSASSQGGVGFSNITNLTIINNTISNNNGTGIGIYDSSIIDLTNNTISNNVELGS
jgi:parallel beta-helix repeat protein